MDGSGDHMDACRGPVVSGKSHEKFIPSPTYAAPFLSKPLGCSNEHAAKFLSRSEKTVGCFFKR